MLTALILHLSRLGAELDGGAAQAAMQWSCGAEGSSDRVVTAAN